MDYGWYMYTYIVFISILLTCLFLLSLSFINHHNIKVFIPHICYVRIFLSLIYITSLILYIGYILYYFNFIRFIITF